MEVRKGDIFGPWVSVEDTSEDVIICRCSTCGNLEEKRIGTLRNFKYKNRKYCNKCKHRKGTLAIDGMKRCARCEVVKSVDEFDDCARAVDHYSSKCKRCREDQRLRDVFGISIEDYEELQDSQGARCAICGRHQSEFNKRFAVDHCHETGDIRGLLCFTCNVGIGYFHHDESLLRRAIGYLQKHARDGSLVKDRKQYSARWRWKGQRLVLNSTAGRDG